MKTLRTVAGPVVGLVVGVVAGALGSVAHWGHRPWGLVAGLALVLASATMMRAWAGRAALAGQAVGLVAALVLLSRPGRSGDVLIELSTTPSLTPDPGVYGRVWVVGSVVAIALVAVAPSALFSDRRSEPRVHGEKAGHGVAGATAPSGRHSDSRSDPRVRGEQQEDETAGDEAWDGWSDRPWGQAAEPDEEAWSDLPWGQSTRPGEDIEGEQPDRQ